ncbi:DUF421 domain-containing protein [Paenibacillus aestuarii]|uniref:DUF421 domain-containing protein n=1 Tax=Paenibacillus aestuarii TaxID=516965 RepID=A0ABW0KFD9_9BACL|nr:YetF domain-containing protein [Paenibacillus aestuarii]
MWTIIWQSAALAIVGTILLRLAGRKSIAQMTTPQLAILLSIGAVLGSEVGGKGMIMTIVATAVFVSSLVVIEWITLKWNAAEKILKGVAIPVITHGTIHMKNLRKLRLTVDDLEKRLRMAGVSRIEDVQTGTIEANGELGFELMPHARPLTLGDLERVLKANFPQITLPRSDTTSDLFTEVSSGAHREKPKNSH